MFNHHLSRILLVTTLISATSITSMAGDPTFVGHQRPTPPYSTNDEKSARSSNNLFVIGAVFVAGFGAGYAVNNLMDANPQSASFAPQYPPSQQQTYQPQEDAWGQPPPPPMPQNTQTNPLPQEIPTIPFPQTPPPPAPLEGDQPPEFNSGNLNAPPPFPDSNNSYTAP